MKRRDFCKLLGVSAALTSFPVRSTTLDASSYSSLADAFSAADSVKYTTGSTLYIPGGTYDGDGLTIPHNTMLIGDGRKSVITGRMNLASHWGMTIKNLYLVDGLNMENARSCHIEDVWFGGKVTMTGSSYYNKFDTCNWYGVETAIEINALCNDNHITASRIHHTGTGLLFNEIAHNWTVRGTSFEGSEAPNNIIGPALRIRGEDHVFDGNRYERGGSNVWDPATIVLESSTARCRIVGGRKGYLFSVSDLGTDNQY
ncbi:hypothetical protein KAR91_32290 [Candidatus Pacearchaeota archaeon]|nr:hypothetical protein [Candidatus Pacearchaeota archaeon]